MFNKVVLSQPNYIWIRTIKTSSNVGGKYTVLYSYCHLLTAWGITVLNSRCMHNYYDKFLSYTNTQSMYKYMKLLPFFTTPAISLAMFSPSLSPSVHNIKCWHPLTSFSNVLCNNSMKLYTCTCKPLQIWNTNVFVQCTLHVHAVIKEWNAGSVGTHSTL